MTGLGDGVTARNAVTKCIRVLPEQPPILWLLWPELSSHSTLPSTRGPERTCPRPHARWRQGACGTSAEVLVNGEKMNQLKLILHLMILPDLSDSLFSGYSSALEVELLRSFLHPR